MASTPDRRHLRWVLQAEGGRLGNLKARHLVSEKYGTLSVDEYEHIKQQLLSSGEIIKGRGRGGSIQLVSQETDEDQLREVTTSEASENEQLDHLFTSLRWIPGARTKRNRKTITLLSGEDNDKLLCGWNKRKAMYFINYRVEPGKENYTELISDLFRTAKEGMPNAYVERRKSDIELLVSDNVAQVNRAIRRLMSMLEDVTLDNAPQSVRDTGKPRPENYYEDIASLIKYCTKKELRWPLKNWRKTLGFDDVDSMIVIGGSPRGLRSSMPYREHVVPVCLIRDEAVRLAEEGAGVYAIANFIKHHLYVVLLTEDEASQLNEKQDKGGLGYKTSMPEGWIFGDNPIERITTAGIQINYKKSIPLHNWKPWHKRKRDQLKDFISRQFSG